MNIIKKIMDSDTLLDVLVQMEDFLDNMDLYAFKNWIDGIIVEGPEISRYWVSMSIMYDYDKMPDPSGAIRLINVGAKVEFKEIELQDNELSTKNKINIDTLGNGYNSNLIGSPIGNNSPKVKKKYNKKWIVEITIPRQFIDDLNSINLDNFDQDVQNSLNKEYGNSEGGINATQ